MKEIYVDIDGILTNETLGHDYVNRTPNKRNINYVNRLYKNNTIILYTARYGIDGIVTRDWLRKYGVKYSHIIYDKPQYEILIDDRTVNNFTEEIVNKLLEED